MLLCPFPTTITITRRAPPNFTLLVKWFQMFLFKTNKYIQHHLFEHSLMEYMIDLITNSL